MSRLQKTSLLALLIVVGIPLAFYFYWKNRYEQRHEQEQLVGQYGMAPFFRMAYGPGDTLSAHDLQGKVYVVNFIFTHCGSICPQLSETFRQIQETFHNDPRVLLVSFTIDPERDSFAVLKQYGQRYGAMQGKWYFLRGDTSTVWRLAQEGFKVPVVYTPEGGHGFEFTHTQLLVLVDGQGMIRGYYSGLDKEAVQRLYDDMGRLLMSM